MTYATCCGPTAASTGSRRFARHAGSSTRIADAFAGSSPRRLRCVITTDSWPSSIMCCSRAGGRYGIDRQVPRARSGDGEQRDHHLERTARRHPDELVGSRAVLDELVRELVRPGVELAIRQLRVTEDHRGRVRRARDLRGDELGERRLARVGEAGAVPPEEHLVALGGGRISSMPTATRGSPAIAVNVCTTCARIRSAATRDQRVEVYSSLRVIAASPYASNVRPRLVRSTQRNRRPRHRGRARRARCRTAGSRTRRGCRTAASHRAPRSRP